ncbi:MAG: thioredoxin [Spirochaetales bacterium]|nr:thioredoxin [Spirochaetales bacterium]
MSVEIILNEDNFNLEVLESDKPVLVDFWAQWCIPCKTLGPVIAEIAEEYKDRLKVGKLEVENAGDLAGAYNIVSIPTLLLFKNGEPVHRQVGAVSRSIVEDMIREHV